MRRKAKGHTIEEPAPVEKTDNVLNLMDALRQSVREAGHTSGKRSTQKALKGKRTRKAA